MKHGTFAVSNFSTVMRWHGMNISTIFIILKIKETDVFHFSQHCLLKAFPTAIFVRELRRNACTVSLCPLFLSTFNQKCNICLSLVKCFSIRFHINPLSGCWLIHMQADRGEKSEANKWSFATFRCERARND